jgi:hypothetical protein
MRESRRRAPEPSSADNRLLTDRDAYLRHLEEQVEKVSAACMLASELKTHHGVLERQVSSALPLFCVFGRTRTQTRSGLFCRD